MVSDSYGVNPVTIAYSVTTTAFCNYWSLTEMEFRYLQPEDAEAAAEIHIEGQPGTVLTLMGHDFLVELYRAISCSEWGEGIGVFDDGQLVAQTAMAVSSPKFFAEFKTRHLWRVAWPITLSVIQKPKIISYIIQGWDYADQTRSPEQEGDVIFLGVKRAYLRHGLAPELVRHMFGWANLIGLKSANFMIEKRNRAMRWMVAQLNDLHVAHEFVAYGRQMLFYKVPIASNLEDAKLPLGQPYTPAYVYSKNGKGEKM
jgi:ribosomal protein S18 acetylase RimI-like enzyme